MAFISHDQKTAGKTHVWIGIGPGTFPGLPSSQVEEVGHIHTKAAPKGLFLCGTPGPVPVNHLVQNHILTSPLIGLMLTVLMFIDC